MASKITVFIVAAEQLFQVDVLYAPFRERCDLMSLKLNQNYTLVKQLMLIYVTVNERAAVWKRKRERDIDGKTTKWMAHKSLIFDIAIANTCTVYDR